VRLNICQALEVLILYIFYWCIIHKIEALAYTLDLIG